MSGRRKVKVVPRENEEPLPVEIIQDSIIKIAAAMEAINKTRLTRKALVALIHDNSKLPKGNIEIVLNNLEELERTWLKKKAV